MSKSIVDYLAVVKPPSILFLIGNSASSHDIILSEVYFVSFSKHILHRYGDATLSLFIEEYVT